MSLVPIASLGQRYGVSVAGMDAIVRIACIIQDITLNQAASPVA